MKILNHYIFTEYSKLIKTGFLWITGPKDLATCRKGEISRQIRSWFILEFGNEIDSICERNPPR
jgi:hypothetical protein